MNNFIEINPKIIEPRELENRCRQSLHSKNINAQNHDLNILNQLKIDFQLMQMKANIHETPITSHRPIIGKFIVFAKKTFRKLTRWLFSAYYNQQNEFNSTALKVISDLIRVQEQILEEQKTKEN